MASRKPKYTKQEHWKDVATAFFVGCVIGMAGVVVAVEQAPEPIVVEILDAYTEERVPSRQLRSPVDADWRADR